MNHTKTWIVEGTGNVLFTVEADNYQEAAYAAFAEMGYSLRCADDPETEVELREEVPDATDPS